MITPEERVALLQAEYQRLEHYLYTLSWEAWNHPSTCDQWTVADVIAHITEGNRNFATWITEALQSQGMQPEHLPRRSNERVDAQAPAHRAIALRKALGDQLLSAFITSRRALEHALAQVGPDDWEKRCYRPTDATPIGTLLETFLAGLSIHRWDVMFPFDPQAQISPECLAVIVERYPHRPRWWNIALPAQHPPLPVRFRFTISGGTAPSADFVITTQEEQYMEVAGNGLADVTFRCEAQTFVLLAYGRLSPASAFSKSTLTYEGNQEWATIFLHAYIGG